MNRRTAWQQSRGSATLIPVTLRQLQFEHTEPVICSKVSRVFSRASMTTATVLRMFASVVRLAALSR